MCCVLPEWLGHALLCIFCVGLVAPSAWLCDLLQPKPEELGRQTSIRAGAITTMLPRLSSGSSAGLALPGSPGTSTRSLPSTPTPATRKDGVVAFENPLAALSKVRFSFAYLLFD
jgi:hypothetical protein